MNVILRPITKNHLSIWKSVSCLKMVQNVRNCSTSEFQKESGSNSNCGPIAIAIRKKLMESLPISNLKIINESYQHKVPNEITESHFRIIVSSNKFQNMSLIERHKLINSILKDEIRQIHAISIETTYNCRDLPNSNESQKCQGGYHKHYKVLFLKYIVQPVSELSVACNEANCNTCHLKHQVCVVCTELYCNQHMTNHLTKHKNHLFYMTLQFGFLHCYRCSVILYTPDLLKIAIECFEQYRTLNSGVRKAFITLSRDLLCESIDLEIIDNSGILGIRPLVNIGSTCYMNSIIQILMNTQPLMVHFLGNVFECKKEHFLDMCHNCVFHELFNEFYKPEAIGFSFIPHKLLVLTYHYFEEFRKGGEEDALEFFTKTIKCLCTCIHTNSAVTNQIILKSIHDSSDNYNATTNNSNSSSTIGKFNGHDSDMCGILTKCCLPSSIYQGILQSKIVCCTCETSSVNKERFVNISLSLDNKNNEPIQLRNLLADFTKEEEILYDCRHCAIVKNKKSTKQYTFSTLPCILVIHFLRFNKNISTNDKVILTKNNNKVRFPLTLDMSDYMTKNSSYKKAKLVDTTYSLFGVISHLSNNIDTGHYIAYVKNNNCWFQITDQYIAKIDVYKVLEVEAFILFYNRNTLNYENQL